MRTNQAKELRTMRVTSSSTYTVELDRDELIQLANALDSFIDYAVVHKTLHPLDQNHRVQDLWRLLEDMK